MEPSITFSLVGVLIPLLALFIDSRIGEFSRYHPLVGFGALASNFEKKVNSYKCQESKILSGELKQKLLGIFGWSLMCLPIPLFLFLIEFSPIIQLAVELFFLYLAIGAHSLSYHARQIYQPLSQSNINLAREKVSLIVSRDTRQLNEAQISRATIESVLENGHDAVIASLFWFLVGGIPLVILHRLANTLDAMWGYKNIKFINFGWFSAKMDDWLGWPSAKLTAVLYILAWNISRRLRNNEGQNSIQTNWRKFFTTVSVQAKSYKSLNGGWTIASGALVLGLKLGGEGLYDGKLVYSAQLGEGELPTAVDIERSLSLVNFSGWLCAFLFSLVLVIQYVVLV